MKIYNIVYSIKALTNNNTGLRLYKTAFKWAGQWDRPIYAHLAARDRLIYPVAKGG